MTERRHLRLVTASDAFEADRPRTRGDCADGPRPCPYVSCQHNLFLDTNEDTGLLTLNFPGLEPDEVPADRSCALDLAERGGATLDDVGLLLNVSRERIRQIESKAFARVRRLSKNPGRASAVLREYEDEGPTLELGNARPRGLGLRAGTAEPTHSDASDEAQEEDEPPTRISFFADGDRADELVCNAVWNIFAKDSNARGFDCRSKGSIAASKNLARQRVARGESAQIKPPKRIEVNSMKDDPTDLTEREKALLAAYRAHVEKHGKPPSRIELGRAVGIKAATEASMQSSVYSATKRLVDLGLMPKGKPGGAPKGTRARVETAKPAKVASIRRPSPARPSKAPVSDVPRSASSSLEVLRGELALVERRAGALRDAIAILESPDYAGAVAS